MEYSVAGYNKLGWQEKSGEMFCMHNLSVANLYLQTVALIIFSISAPPN